jgi:mucin-19
MAQRKGISTGTTAQRTIEEAGKIRFNTSTNLLEYYDGTTWKAIDAPPVVSSVSPTNLLSGDGTGNHTIVVSGSGFSSSVTTVLITAGGTEITPDTVTRDSATQVTLVVAKNKTNLTNANEPFDVKITNTSGLTGTLVGALNVDASPVFSTAAGSLGTTFDSGRGSFSTITIEAADPESGGDVVYTIESGSLPAGLSGSSTSSGYAISGTPDAVGSNTTSNFTIRAKDAASNISDRAFSLTVNAPVITSFTTSGTFSVPSGLTSINVLVVGGGAGGGKSPGNGGGGGGAGGLIYRPGFSVTPGGTVTVTVGDGGGATGGFASNAPSVNGQNSVFGTLTANGGGSGGAHGSGGNPGGSGGGAGRDSNGAAAGSATQPNQPGESGNYGFGYAGGIDGSSSGSSTGGGGGGAGAAGNAGYVPDGAATPGTASRGGNGKSYSISGTSVGYAGGGSGSSGHPNTGIPGNPTFGSGGYDSAGSGEGHGTGATANRGSGGGAGRGNGYNTGAGGKGIVIVSY